MVTKTIGTLGDYPDINSAINDLIATGVIFDNYYLKLISNVINTTTVSSSNIKINNSVNIDFDLNGYTITSDRTIRMSMRDPTNYTGSITLRNGNIFYNCLFGSNPINYLDLQCRGLQFAGTPGPLRFTLNNLFVSNHLTTVDSNINHSLISMVNALENAFYYSGYATYRIYNVKTYFNGRSNNLYFSGESAGSGSGIGPYALIENCSLYNVNKIASQATVYTQEPFAWANYPRVKNVICCGAWLCGTAYPNADFINCAETDSSLALSGPYGTVINKTSGVSDSDFKSVDPTNPDFLKLPKGRISSIPNLNPNAGSAPLRVKFNGNIEYSYGSNKLYNTGIIPSLTLNDLDGNPYGQWGNYPIGCYNAELVE